MDELELKQRFPNASGSFIRANASGGVRDGAVCERGDTGEVAELERDTRDGALGARQIQNLHSGKVLVRLTSYRTRLLDEDNLCEKYHIDCCRYAGLIRQDSPGAAKIEVRQEKVGKGEPEFVRIEIFQAETASAILT